MAYFKATFKKSSGNKASPFIRPLAMVNLSEQVGYMQGYAVRKMEKDK
jgi:hypothetical protein